MIRGLMLVALVASKLEPKPENKPKFIDYTPEPRKKRKYKRMTDDIHELQRIVSEQQKEIERLKTPSASTLEIEKMIAGLKEAAIHYDEMAYKLGYTSLMHHTMTYVMLTENYPKLVSEQSQRIQQLEEALREVYDWYFVEVPEQFPEEKIESLLTPKP